MYMDIKNIIQKNLILRGIDISSIQENSTLESLGLDSLDLVEIMLEIEKEVNVSFSITELANLETVKDVKKLIEIKLK